MKIIFTRVKQEHYWLLWLGFCAGFSRLEYASSWEVLANSPHVFLQVDGKGSIKELFPTGKQLEPLVAPLADGKVAVGQDDLTVVLNEEGVCTQKCALNWTDIPVAMGEASSSCCFVLWMQAVSSL